MINRPVENIESFDGLSFEEAMATLDETVRVLEDGQLPLAEATRLYERGMVLTRLCSDMLTSAELKVTQIQTTYGQQIRVLPEEES